MFDEQQHAVLEHFKCKRCKNGKFACKSPKKTITVLYEMQIRCQICLDQFVLRWDMRMPDKPIVMQRSSRGYNSRERVTDLWWVSREPPGAQVYHAEQNETVSLRERANGDSQEKDNQPGAA